MENSPKPIQTEISIEFIELLKEECAKVATICQNLNADQKFANAAASLAASDFNAQTSNAAHILLRDVVVLFNKVVVLQGEVDKMPIRAKFLLIYVYESLRGKDLSNTYNIEKMNALTKAEPFNKNIATVRETSFFQPLADMNEEFLMPSILQKIKNENASGIASFLNRIATLLVKADNRISKKEKDFLVKISEKINHPKIIISKAKYNEVPEDDTMEKVLGELHELIGMVGIKKNVEDLTNFLKVQKIRETEGLKTMNTSPHMVFMGPPGTGKTTVARLLGRIYKHLGYLEKGHLIETDRAGMVAGYVGQTAIKTDEIITSALGGVLFIDEAYSLTSNGFNDFGGEAIEILLKRMEDHRAKFVVVVAGYPDEMQGFIQSNPGLQSRFNRYFEFDHFTAEELMQIFKLNVSKADFILTEEAEDKLNEILMKLYEKRDRSFGNARTMRNLFEKIIERQANRIVSITPITKDLLMNLMEEDIPEINETVKSILLFQDEE